MLISTESLENISPKPDLEPVNINLYAYNGSKIPVLGKCSLILAHNNKSLKVSFRLCTHSRTENKRTFTTCKKNL